MCNRNLLMKLPNGRLDLSASCYNLLFLYVQQEKENGSEREMNTFVHLQEEILQYFLRFPQYILISLERQLLWGFSQMRCRRKWKIIHSGRLHRSR